MKNSRPWGILILLAFSPTKKTSINYIVGTLRRLGNQPTACLFSPFSYLTNLNEYIHRLNSLELFEIKNFGCDRLFSYCKSTTENAQKSKDYNQVIHSGDYGTYSNSLNCEPMILPFPAFA